MNAYMRSGIYQKVTSWRWRLFVKYLLLSVASIILLFLLLNFLFPLPAFPSYSVEVEDDRGNLLNASLTPDEKWRLNVSSNDISPLLKKTILAKEDRYFYSHPGVNFLAVARAAIRNVARMKRTSGASTITMQLARALEPRPRNMMSKLIEMFRAFQLELHYSKDEILTRYLSLVPYGGNIEGVRTASLLYFGKNPDHLSLAEITALSIIPNRPSSLVMGRNNDAIVKERNLWLHRFQEDGLFTPKEITDALSEPLDAHRGNFPHRLPHLTRKLKSTAAPSIRTYIETEMQTRIEVLTADYIRGLKLSGIRNAAVIVVDNSTRKVVSYLGSASFSDTIDGGQVNGAAAIRQPGSTLKPLLYGLCIDKGLLTPKTMLADIPVNYQGYAPENYDRTFHGLISMEHALDMSLNVPAVRSLNQLGVEDMKESLIQCGFRQIQKDKGKLGLSMILGGCGATLEELTGLFATFANDGNYAPLRYSASDSPGKPIRILSDEANYLITDILSRVNRPDFPMNWSATAHMPKIAWKTGTSYGKRDGWSIGYNKNFTVGIWVGNFSGNGVADLSGANSATPLLFKIFNTIDYDSNSEWYVPPGKLGWRVVCEVSGLPPGPYCHRTVTDAYLPLISSTQPCTHVREVKVAPDSSISYCDACAPATGFRTKLYPAITAELQAYYLNEGKKYDAVPPHNPNCEKIFSGSAPAIQSPLNGNTYYLERKNPEPVMLKGTAGADVNTLYWYVNDKFYKTSKPGARLFFMPVEGKVKISCADDKGRNRDIYITATYIRM